MNEDNKQELKVGSIVWVDDDADSGYYEVKRINENMNDCWLVGYDIGSHKQIVEQQFPLSWVKKMRIKSDD